MANAAFELGWQTRQQEHDAKRQRKEALEDEARQLRVKDLWDQRLAIRENLSKLGAPQQADAFQAWAKANPGQAANFQQGTAAMQSIQMQLDDLHDPVKNPGALQRDWEFIKGLITRKRPAAPAPVTTAAAPAATTAAAPLPPGIVAPEPWTAAVTSTPGAPPEAAGGVSKAPAPVLSAAETMAVPTPKIKGLVAQGNIPIWSRPVVKNADGSHSSEFSTSFTDENPQSPYYGKEVLVPTVVNGKFLTPDGTKPPAGSPAEQAMMERARAHYEQTGEQLGVFRDAAAADKYAEALHTRGEKKRPDAAAYQTPQQRQQQQRQQRAQQEVQQFMQAGPPSPEEAGVEAARAQVAANKIKVDGLMAQWRELNPEATKEDEAAARREVFENVSGFKSALTAGKWTRGTATINGVPKQPVIFNEKTGEYRYGGGQPIPAEILNDPQTFMPDSSSGKAAKGLTYVKASDSVKDMDTGKPYFRGDPNNPPDVVKLFEGFDRATAATQEFSKELAEKRGTGYNDSRRVNVIDTTSGATTVITYAELSKDPNRYLVATEYDKWSPRVNMLEDLRGSSRIVRDSINKLKASGGFDFEGDVLTALHKALSDAHPRTAVDQLISTGALAGLSEDQQKYIIATSSMIEQAMGMRTILGAGQGSDDVRNAIVATIPSLLTPSPQFALNQMDMFDGTLERVHRMIPSNVRLTYNLGDAPWTVQDKPSPYSEIEQGGAARPVRRGGAAGGGAAGGGAAGAKGGRSIGKVKTWMQGQPQWKGQTVTDQMATDYILSQHYTPTSP